jgi:NAD(P)-dependent dehydrogenase (short-subunit alcohol dehydrogenase family)
MSRGGRVVAEHEVLAGHHQLSVNPGHGPGAVLRNARKRFGEAAQLNLQPSGGAQLERLSEHLVNRRYERGPMMLSGGGATNPLPRISAYAASKAAIVRFMETLSEELRDFGIDVNSIAPGALNTRMLQEVLAAGPEKVGTVFFERSVKQKEAGGTGLEPGAALAVFLASDASNGITGKLISAVWDNWAAWPSHLAQLSSSDLYTLRRIAGRDRNATWGDK